MNIQQLEYIVAVDNHRHFVNAAEACHVTQPTLSMMIHKLEDELECRIFDRSAQPVVPTEIGQRLIAQARQILLEVGKLKDLAQEERGTVSGSLTLGIIPTIAPYLLPSLIPDFIRQYPQVQFRIMEMITEEAIEALIKARIDCAILATPLHNTLLKEKVLYYEKFYAYVSPAETGYKLPQIIPARLDPDRIWLLEEGHCFRSQIVNFCELTKDRSAQFTYEAGSIETLIRLVDRHSGMTFIPELSLMTLSAAQKKNVKKIHEPVPVREISLVTRYGFVKQKLIRVLEENCLKIIPPAMARLNKKQYAVELI
ncbi:MAG TPA: LysR substrate-binding domain-containing protein [Bacteroidales bacterium]|nr:LysR substrate-binding domain-containing protein [Bacteroidales bacterium]HSA42164.1 LysR substrate-binding domain-containing protein [Bacteroidales bacterium]